MFIVFLILINIKVYTTRWQDQVLAVAFAAALLLPWFYSLLWDHSNNRSRNYSLFSESFERSDGILLKYERSKVQSFSDNDYASTSDLHQDQPVRSRVHPDNF